MYHSTLTKHLPKIGTRFGRLVVWHPLFMRHQKPFFRCVCDCGNYHDTDIYSVINGKTSSCGCYQKEAPITHGQAYSPTYHSWQHIKQRCSDPNFPNFKDYGGRGVSYCARWESFENFLEDMGERPDGKTIDREDVDGNYTPDNCRWATSEEQARNKRNTVYLKVDGRVATIPEHCERLGLNGSTVRTRLSRGWSVDTAFKKPIGRYNCATRN
jgi:hypothetical protein